MNWMHYLFGFGGRINRAKQWAFLAGVFVWQAAMSVLYGRMVGFDNFEHAIELHVLAGFIRTPQFKLFTLICALFLLVITYMAFAVTTKRLHDRNKGAVWLLVFILLPILLNVPRILQVAQMLGDLNAYVQSVQAGEPKPLNDSPLATLAGGVALLIQLWAFVELYCLRGTVGNNPYGPDPLVKTS